MSVHVPGIKPYCIHSYWLLFLVLASLTRSEPVELERGEGTRVTRGVVEGEDTRMLAINKVNKLTLDL